MQFHNYKQFSANTYRPVLTNFKKKLKTLKIINISTKNKLVQKLFLIIVKLQNSVLYFLKNHICIYC